jgi:hypothetical protein
MPTLRKINRAVSPNSSRPITAHLIFPDIFMPTHHPNIIENLFGPFCPKKILLLILDII